MRSNLQPTFEVNLAIRGPGRVAKEYIYIFQRGDRDSERKTERCVGECV